MAYTTVRGSHKYDPKKKQQQKLDNYLNANKKKKYSIIIALADSFDERLRVDLENYVKSMYEGQCSVYSIKDRTGFLKHFNKNVRLLIMDDQFDESQNVMKMVRALKQKQFEDIVPVLFLTDNSQELIKSYRENLAAYHEVDDLCVYKSMRLEEIFEKINHGVIKQNRRRSRRYSVDVDAYFCRLSEDQKHEAKIIDLSIHGAMLKYQSTELLKVGDQLKISIPMYKYMNSEMDDILKMSAKVRRIGLSGDRAAISFEHMSDSQIQRLTGFVTGLAISQYGKSNSW